MSEDSSLKQILGKWGKIQLADHCRLMADNQATLDRSNASDRDHREFQRRLRETLARKSGLALPPAAESAEEDAVEINIDSPTSVTYQQQPASRAAWLPTVLAGLALAGGGAGLGAAALSLLSRDGSTSPPPPPVTTQDDRDTQYEMRLLPARDTDP